MAPSTGAIAGDIGRRERQIQATLSGVLSQAQKLNQHEQTYRLKRAKSYAHPRLRGDSFKRFNIFSKTNENVGLAPSSLLRNRLERPCKIPSRFSAKPLFAIFLFRLLLPSRSRLRP